MESNYRDGPTGHKNLLRELNKRIIYAHCIPHKKLCVCVRVEGEEGGWDKTSTSVKQPNFSKATGKYTCTCKCTCSWVRNSINI